MQLQVCALNAGRKAMPQDTFSAQRKPSKAGRLMSKLEMESESSLPLTVRMRLHDLFGQIEKEFEGLHNENVSLQEKIDILNEKLERESIICHTDNRAADLTDAESGITKITSKHKSSQAANIIKTKEKLKAQTSKIVSSFKAPSISSQLVKEYLGHTDGVWEVTAPKLLPGIIATASADRSARIWAVDSATCLLQYVGHNGSVNSIRFHPTQELVLTASGDQTAHVWRANVSVPPLMEQPHTHSSEDELSEKEEKGYDDVEQLPEGSLLRSPLIEFTGHISVVIGADWLYGGEQIITASWDRTANLYDVQTGELLHSLVGHDQDLTYVCAHPTQRLVVTCSKDTTFRLWDFREHIHAVSVFQGHTETVTSASFASGDKVVSGSDDRSVKVWDLKNMRSPLATVRLDSPVNRLSVSNQHMIAIPHDNRNIRLYDLNGIRLARLPRNNRLGHRSMVCSAAWLEDGQGQSPNLFSCGFDRLVLGWKVSPSTKEGKDGKD